MYFENSPFYRVTANRHSARIGLASLATAALTVLIAASNACGQVIIQDMFSGTPNSTIVGNAPDTANLPSGVWGAASAAGVYNTTPNQLAITASNGSLFLPTSSGSYTPPTTLTLSASLSTG